MDNTILPHIPQTNSGQLASESLKRISESKDLAGAVNEGMTSLGSIETGGNEKERAFAAATQNATRALLSYYQALKAQSPAESHGSCLEFIKNAQLITLSSIASGVKGTTGEIIAGAALNVLDKTTESPLRCALGGAYLSEIAVHGSGPAQAISAAALTSTSGLGNYSSREEGAAISEKVMEEALKICSGSEVADLDKAIARIGRLGMTAGGKSPSTAANDFGGEILKILSRSGRPGTKILSDAALNGAKHTYFNGDLRTVPYLWTLNTVAQGTSAPVGIALTQIGKAFVQSQLPLDNHSFIAQTGIKYLDATAATQENPLTSLLAETVAKALRGIDGALASEVLLPLYDEIGLRTGGSIEKHLVECGLIAAEHVRRAAGKLGSMGKEGEYGQRVVLGEFLAALRDHTQDPVIRKTAEDALKRTPGRGRLKSLIGWRKPEDHGSANKIRMEALLMINAGLRAREKMEELGPDADAIGSEIKGGEGSVPGSIELYEEWGIVNIDGMRIPQSIDS